VASFALGSEKRKGKLPSEAKRPASIGRLAGWISLFGGKEMAKHSNNLNLVVASFEVVVTTTRCIVS